MYRARGYRLRPVARRCLVTVGLALGLPARALVVQEAEPDAALRAPPDPRTGFEHVGGVGATTGVYLGEGWVLTAAHVGAQELRLDGERYPALPGSWAGVKGALGSTPADLGVFRVQPRPPLVSLAIARGSPKVGEPLLLVGCGHGRGERFEWDGRVGFRWAPPNVRRWGTNRVAAVGLDLPPAEGTRIFTTLFSAGDPSEAQAAIGDSGGAAFVRRRGDWLLAGIMIAVATFRGQPPQTAVAGNATHLADLSYYRDSILALTGLSGTGGGPP